MRACVRARRVADSTGGRVYFLNGAWAYTATGLHSTATQPLAAISCAKNILSSSFLLTLPIALRGSGAPRNT